MKILATTFVVRHSKTLLVFVLLNLLAGCSLYSLQANTVRDALMRDQVDLAYRLVEKQNRYSDSVLKDMNKGILLRMKKDFVSSNNSLEQAKQRINQLYGISVTDQLGSVVINDAVRAYEGTRIEQLLLHAYMAMNYIETGNLDAARVEMLQAEVKMREWGDQPDDDPFIKYLTGMIYEALDEDDQAIVAYRHAVSAYKTNRTKQNLDVPSLLISDLIRLLTSEGLSDEARVLKDEYSLPANITTKANSSKGQLIVILSNGLSPIKSENSITTFADEIEKSVRIALPVYARPPDRLTMARISIDGYSDNLKTVENVDGLARNALDEEMPLILTRAIARAIVKHKTQDKAKAKGDNPMGGFLLTMTNLITERADTRSWSTLPQEIQMSRQALSSGKYQLDIEMVNNAGFVVDRMTDEVEIKSGKVTFIFKHWVSPRVKIKAGPDQTEPLIDGGSENKVISHAIQRERKTMHA